MFEEFLDPAAEFAFTPAAIHPMLTDSFAIEDITLARSQKMRGINSQRTAMLLDILAMPTETLGHLRHHKR